MTERDIRRDRLCEQEALAFAILRDQRDTVLHGIRGRRDLHRLERAAIMRDGYDAGIGTIRPVDEPHQLRAARANQTADAENLASLDLKRDIAHGRLTRHPRDLQRHVANAPLAKIDPLADIASHHQCHETVSRKVGHFVDMH